MGDLLDRRGRPVARRLAADEPDSHRQAVYAIEALAEGGPNLGRPLVDRIKGSSLHNLKELRPGSAGTTGMRILFAFDPWRSSVPLVAGDKSGRWREWYRQAIPHAELLYESYLKERTAEVEEDGDEHGSVVGHPGQARRSDR